MSQGVLKIHVAGGAVVTALWDGKGAIDALRLLLIRDLVCEGLGVILPCGTLLRVDADAVAAAGAADASFAVVPRAPRLGDVAHRTLLKAGEPSGYPVPPGG